MLTSTEFALLATLMRQPGRVFTRAQLLDAMHGDGGRVVRPRRRRARQEPAPQDRGRPARAAAPADGLRRRLPVHRRMSRERCRDGAAAGGDDRPWPPRPVVGDERAGARALLPPRRHRPGRPGRDGRPRRGRARLAAGRAGRPAAVDRRRPGGAGDPRRHVRPGRGVRHGARRRRPARAPSWTPPIASPAATTPSASREGGPPPVRALARAFNAMTERLAHADRQRRDLMADVAHELRTPLAVVQGRLEGLLDGVYPRDDRQLAALLEETQVLSRLIEDLRTLALADAGALRLEREPTDLVAPGPRRGARLRARGGAPPGDADGDGRSRPRRGRSTSTRCASGRCCRTCWRTPCAIRRPAAAIAVSVAAAGAAAVAVAVANAGDGIAARGRGAHFRPVLQGRGVPRLRPRADHRQAAGRRPRRGDRGDQRARRRARP